MKVVAAKMNSQKVRPGILAQVKYKYENLFLSPQAYGVLTLTCFKKLSRDIPGGPVVKNPPYNAGDMGSIPGQGTKIPHATGQLSPCATTTELARLNQSPHATNYRAHALWTPHATTREEKTLTPQLERSPCTTMKSPCATTKDPVCLNEDLACCN